MTSKFVTSFFLMFIGGVMGIIFDYYDDRHIDEIKTLHEQRGQAVEYRNLPTGGYHIAEILDPAENEALVVQVQPSIGNTYFVRNIPREKLLQDGEFKLDQ